MKNEEQKSAFILRVEEIEHELEMLVNDKGGVRSPASSS